MPITGYTTRVDASKTVGQVISLLAKQGAREVRAVYDGDVIPAALSFSYPTPWGETEFRLPIRVDGVHAYLQRERAKGRIDRDQHATRKHAANVAWRLCLEWLQVQIALIETGMARLEEIMMPYALVGEERRSLFDTFVAERKLLPPQRKEGE